MLRATITSVSENDNNLISFIATTVETLRDQMETVGHQVDTLRDQMDTVRDQVENVRDQVESLHGQVGTMRKEMATKNDLNRLETTMHGEFEQVHLRLDSIDRSHANRMGQVESEVSRIRSVVYLLVKDKPEMLRLLGQPLPAEDRPPS